MLEGPHGCGKTTALKSVIQAVGSNIIYFTVDQSKDFGVSLAKALSIDLGCRDAPFFLDPIFEQLSIKRGCPKTLDDKVGVCWNLLENTLKLIQKEGHSTPVLIIDHVNLLLDESAPKSDLIFTLQAFAKRVADERLLTIYFVSSERKVYHMFIRNQLIRDWLLFPLAPGTSLMQKL